MPDSFVSPTWEIREGDALERLREMPDESVHCCVTSPPYFGLRDYGVDGQIGLEATPEEFASRLGDVMEEVRRVLRSDGTLWLNLGDSYSAAGGKRPNSQKGPGLQGTSQSLRGAIARTRSVPPGLKSKDLIGLPWLVAFDLRARGWYLRSEVIWSKPNPMPESVQDRPTRSHEHIFLLAKSERYFYDADAIREPDKGTDHARTILSGQPSLEASLGGNHTGLRTSNGRNGQGANKKSVWHLPTNGFPLAHFATFPPKLIEPCILAGCPEGGTVLDPFSGAATTGLVALRYGRSYIGIELNPEYVELARRRIHDDAPLLNAPAEIYAADGHSSRSMSSITAAGLR